LKRFTHPFPEISNRERRAFLLSHTLTFRASWSDGMIFQQIQRVQDSINLENHLLNRVL